MSMNKSGIDYTITLFQRACLSSGLRPAGPWKAKLKSLLSHYTITLETMIEAFRIEGMAGQTDNFLHMQYQDISRVDVKAVNWRTDIVEQMGASLKEFIDYLLVFKDASAYERQLTNDVHALYSRAMSRRGFVSDVGAIIERQLNEAWKSGADEMMVLPEDFTPEDNAYIAKIISDEKAHVEGFADSVQNAAGNGEGWVQFQGRISIWVNRIADVENRARMYFGGKQRLKWVLGPTEEHCENCSKLNGLVAWATEWEASGVHPQSPPNERIECHGWNCGCQLIPVEERRTRNAKSEIQRRARAA